MARRARFGQRQGAGQKLPARVARCRRAASSDASKMYDVDVVVGI